MALPNTDLLVPVLVEQKKAESSVMLQSRATGDVWLSVISEDVLIKGASWSNGLSWAAYHANRHPAEVRAQCHIARIPLFVEPAHTAATIVHVKNLVKKAIHSLHPGQISAITTDQQLFCIAKQIP